MSKSSFAGLATLSVVAVLACEPVPTAVDNAMPPDLRAVEKIADDNVWFPVTRHLNNPCTPPEIIEFTGTVHAKFRVWDRNGDGQVSPGDLMKIHVQESIEGTDANGVKYRALDVHNMGGGVFDPPWTSTRVQRVISSTRQDNFLVTSLLTISGQGDVKVDHVSAKCVG